MSATPDILDWTHGPLWVFAYGSLIWNPGIAVAESRVARLSDYSRSFCMRSIHHRGSEDAPGLVLALDTHPGGACEGLALRAEPGTEAVALEELRARELISSAYVERHVTLRLDDGRQVTALAYVIEREHDQYCGGLPLEEQARIIAAATGGRGPNSEYLFNTTGMLSRLGIADEELSWLERRVRALTG